MAETKSPYTVEYLISPAEERLLLRLRQLPTGAHLLTLNTNSKGPQELTIWSGYGCQTSRLDRESG